MKTLITILMFMMISFNAQAGREGGGGTGVVCLGAQGQVKSVLQVYDFWNSNREYNMNVPIDNETPYMEQIERNIQRIEKIDPLLARHMREQAQFFAEGEINQNPQVGFVDEFNDEFAKSDDGKHMLKPKSGPGSDCDKLELRRMAYFKDKPIIPFERKFLLVEELWLKATESAKYGLVQHEIIYDIARKFGNEDSVKAQFFNAFISSEEFNVMDWERYGPFVRYHMGWKDNYVTPYFSLQMGDIIATTDFKTYKDNLGEYIIESDVLTSDALPEEQKVTFAQRTVRPVDDFYMNPDLSLKCVKMKDTLKGADTYIGQADLSPLRHTCQDKNGKVYRGSVESVVDFSYKGTTFKISPVRSGLSFSFNPNTKKPMKFYASFCAENGRKVRIKQGGKSWRLRGFYRFRFNEDGGIKDVERMSRCPKD